jgi:hypothetical protein
MMITCKLCDKKFKKITNTHLRDKHSTTLDQYLNMFPGTIMTSEETINAISISSKGKTYEQRYGKEVSDRLLELRKIHALRQFENDAQREVRRKHNWKGYEMIAGITWTDYKNGAANRSLEFNITIEEVWDVYEKQQRLCALTGVPITFNMELGELSRKGYQVKTASLDRIDSKQGYILGNIQWIHKDINKLKSNWPQDKFIEMCKAVTDYQVNKYKSNKLK